MFYVMFVSYFLFHFLILYMFLKYSLIIIKKFYGKLVYNNVNLQIYKITFSENGLRVLYYIHCPEYNNM
jgi:hypothetical protein